MTPEEAIKILQQLRIKYWDNFSNKELHASSLGIEALKALGDFRRDDFTYLEELLPGETKE